STMNPLPVIRTSRAALIAQPSGDRRGTGDRFGNQAYHRASRRPALCPREHRRWAVRQDRLSAASPGPSARALDAAIIQSIGVVLPAIRDGEDISHLGSVIWYAIHWVRLNWQDSALDLHAMVATGPRRRRRPNPFPRRNPSAPVAPCIIIELHRILLFPAEINCHLELLITLLMIDRQKTSGHLCPPSPGAR